MRAAGKKAQAGQEARLADIPSETGKYGVFEELHRHEGGEAFARALTQAAHKHHGTAARAFLRQLVALDPAEVAKQVGALRDDFMKEHVPRDASGQVQRVAMRFALVAAGGNLATSMGITGWPEGEAIKAAVRCFKDWLAAWGGVGNKEIEAALSQVRHFFELHGESRFTAWDGDGDRPTINRAGFRRVNEAGKTEFYVLPESFKSELCAGLDSSFVAKKLIERGLLAPDQHDGKSAARHRLPGMGVKRCYYFPAKENEE